MGREARILATSDHPNIIRSFQVGRAREIEFMALEALKGETLADRLDRDVWIPFEDGCRIARDVALALSHLHQNEIVHRDLRPETIWVNEDGSAKLVDFSGATDEFSAYDVDEQGHPLVDIDAVITNRQYQYDNLVKENHNHHPNHQNKHSKQQPYIIHPKNEPDQARPLTL